MTQIDPRLAFLARAATRMHLFEIGEIDLEEAFEGLIDEDEMASFWRACDRADDRQRRKSADPKLERLHRLMDDDVSLERAYAAINSGRPTPESTIEAIKQAVRDRGVKALEEPDTKARLQNCDNAARKELQRWSSGR
jgi:hypothetical protein